MAHIVTLNTPSREDWLTQLADVVTDPDELLRLLNIDADEKLLAGRSAKKLFALRVPRSFIDRMEKGNPDDPLLRQVLTSQDEFVVASGFSTDPLEEQHSVVPGLLHKYHNRALLLVKGGCAVNCRYCFRRHFPYAENQGNKRNWQTALEYVAAHPELDEMIFSGGDPLMAKDHELDWLLTQLEAIPHIKRLRIHSRLPIVIPARITEALVENEFAGILTLDERRGRERGIGWIAFLYVVPELRGHHCGIQLVGTAAMRFRQLGRRAMRLTVAPENPALGFYEKAGFVRVGTEAGALGDLLVMEWTL